MTTDVTKINPQRRSDRFVFKADETTREVIGPDGLPHLTEGSALFHSLGCTCGCGDPNEQHEFIKEALHNFDRKANGWEGAAGVKGLEALVAAHPDRAAEFIAHVLASESLVEYGGSVYGAWLTDRGAQYMESDAYKDYLDGDDEE